MDWLMKWRTRTRAWCVVGAGLAALTLHVAAAEPAMKVIATSTPLAGTLVETRFFSPTLGREVPYRVYLPPDYAGGTHHYPVLYMLHGAGGNYTEWSDSFLPDRTDEMIRRGEIQPMIVAMPEGGNRTYWANFPDGPHWADYVAADFVGEVDSHYRTLAIPASRAIGGLSMGGLGALHIALHHPDVFGVVGGHSPSIRVEPDPRAAGSLLGNTFYEHSPIWLLQHRWQPGGHLSMWVDVGLEDGWRPNIEAFGAVLQSSGIDSTWHEFPGTHEDTYWTAHIPDYLRFYAANLRADDSSPANDLVAVPGPADSANPSSAGDPQL